MFDSDGAFKRQFTRVEGGYLVYPSPKVGGKLVSVEEYQELVQGWKRVTGRSASWKATGGIVAVITLWTLLSDALSLPEWVYPLFITAIVLAMSAWMLWASTAPRRLVKDRTPVTPPRMAKERRRDARAALTWPFVAFALLFSGVAFFGSIAVTARSVGSWAWLLISGAILGLNIWIAISKLADRTR